MKNSLPPCSNFSYMFKLVLTLFSVILATDSLPGVSYAGSEACVKCHKAIYNSFIKTGHYNMVKKVSDVAPEYPFASVPRPPDGHQWSDIRYTVGCAGRIDFIDKDGYVFCEYVTGDSSFHPMEKRPYSSVSYSCAWCHNTGWIAPDSGPAAAHQDGLPGIAGTWAFSGIQCEACHGPGNAHIKSKKKRHISRDSTTALCEKCHRVKATFLEAQDNFLVSKQFLEITNTRHKDLKCMTCHNPHRTTIRDTLGKAIKRKCEDCHPAQTASYRRNSKAMSDSGVTCLDCHMPMARKMALSYGKYRGDSRTHLVRINTDSTALQFHPEKPKKAFPWLTVEFACLGCHEDKDKAWAVPFANTVHDRAKVK